MKNIAPQLINLFKTGFCTPQIARIAKKIKQPAATIHYNIKKLEKEGAIKTYKAVFDHKKIDLGHCTYLLINLNQEKYGDPEHVAKRIAKNDHVESVDITTGEYELIVKLRSKDIDDYYTFIKMAIKEYGIAKVLTLTSLKQVKTDNVMM